MHNNGVNHGPEVGEEGWRWEIGAELTYMRPIGGENIRVRTHEHRSPPWHLSENP